MSDEPAATTERIDLIATIRRLGPAGVLGVLWSLLPVGGLVVLGWNLGKVTRFLTDDRAVGLAVYIAVFAVSAGLALLPTWAQSLIGGWAFGFGAGASAAVGAIMIASWIGHEVARGASSDRVETIIREHPKWKAVRDELVCARFWRAVGIVTLIRLPPNSPFAVTNLVLTSAGVGRRAYLLGTLLGITPRTCLTVFLGSQIHDMTVESLKTPKWVIGLSVGVTVVVILIVAAIGKRALDRIGAGANVPVDAGAAENDGPR